MNIGENIKKARRTRNMTQGELAKLVGVSNQMIYTWEHSNNNLTVSTLTKIVTALDMPIENLINTNIIGEEKYKEVRGIGKDTLDIAEEKLECKGFVKREGFEKTTSLLMTMTQEAWRIMQQHKSFRLVIDYDAKALNTNYYFYVPSDKSESDGSSQD